MIMNRHSKTIGSALRASVVGLATLMTPVLVFGSPLGSGQTDVGRAIADAGGNELQIRAGDAIFVTCAGLDGTNNKTPDQVALNLRCADMSQQALFLDPTPDSGTAIPGADVFSLGSLGQAGVQQYFGLLQQFSGEEVSTQGRYATEGSTSQFKSLAGRLSAIRRGARNSGLAFNLQGIDVFTVTDADDPDRAPGGLIGGAAGESDADLGWAWFGNVEYGFGDRDASANENAYDAESWAAVFGVDYAISESLVVGAAINISRVDVDFDREDSAGLESVSGGGVESDSEAISIFANFVDGAMYVSAIASIGRGDVDMSRVVNISLPTNNTGASGGQAPLLVRADSDTETDQWAAETQIGYTLGEGATTWDIYGGLGIATLEIDGFTESGTPLGLTFGSQEVDSFEGFLGLGFRHAMSTSKGVFVPYATVEYRHEFDNESRNLSARYTLTPRAPGEIFQGETDDFEIPTDDADSSYFDATIGVLSQFGNNMAIFMQYNTLLGLSDVSANVITLGVRGSF